MKRGRSRALLIVTLIAAAIAAAAPGILRLGAERLRRTIATRASAALGGEVTIERVEIAALRRTVRLRGVAALKTGNRGSSAALRAEEVSARAGVLTLLGWRRGSISLLIENPDLRLVLAPGRDLAFRGAPADPSPMALVPANLRVSIVGGTADVAVRDGPGARFEGVRAELRPEGPPPAVRGHVAFEKGEVRGVPGSWKGLGGEVGFVAVGGDLRIDSLMLRGDGLALSGHGAIRPAAGGPGAGVPDAEGEIRAGVEIETLKGLLPEAAQPSGRIEVRLRGGLRGGRPEARGDLSAVAIRLFGVDLDTLRSDLEIGERFTATGLRAHLLGGAATGSIVASRSGDRIGAEFDVRVDGIDLAQVLALGGWSGPAVNGTLHYRGRHTINDTGLASLRGSGLFDAVGHYAAPRGADLPLEVTSSVESEGARLRLGEGTVQAGSVRGTFSGTVAPGEGIRLRLRGATGDLSEVLPLFSAPPPPAPGKETAPVTPAAPGTVRPVRLLALTPEPAPASHLETLIRALGGTWSWDGDLQYNRDGLRFDGMLSGAGLTLSGTPVGDMEARVSYRGTSLQIREATLNAAGGGEIRMSGSIGFGAPGTMEIAATAAGCAISPLLAILRQPLPIDGRLDARVHVGGRPDAPAGRITLSLPSPRIAGVAFDDLRGDIVFTPDLLELHELILSQGDGRLRLEGSLPYRGAPPGGGVVSGVEPAITVEGRDFRLDRLAGRASITGTARLVGRIAGGIDAPSGRLDLAADEVVIAGEPVGPVTLQATLAEGAMAIEGGAPGRGVTIAGKVALDPGWPADIAVTLSGTTIRPGALIGTVDAASVGIAGRVDLSGPILAPRDLEARAVFERITADIAGVAVESDGPVRAALERGRVRFEPFVIQGDGTEVRLGAALDLREGGGIEAEARGMFDLRLLKPIFRRLQATGSGSIELLARGPVDDPVLEGDLEVIAGAVRHPGLPFPIDALTMRARFEGSRMSLETLRFRAGGGLVEGDGTVVLSARPERGLPFSIREAAVHLRGQGIKSEYPEKFRAVSNIDLTLGAGPDGAVLGGSIDVVKGVYEREFRISATLAGPAPGPPVSPVAPDDPIANLRLDVRIRAARDVWVRNSLASIEGEGELGLAGTLARPSVSGRITAREGGSFKFRGSTYRVVSGAADFADPETINPVFDIMAETTVAEYEVSLHAEGAVDNFKYELSSRPPLPQQDLVALLLTGRTLEDLGPGSRTSLGDEAVRAYLTGVLNEELSEKVAGRAGLDVLAFEPLAVNDTGDPTARFTVGKRVTPDLLVTYSSDLSSTQGAIYQLDYSVRRDLRLTTMRDSDGSIGGDLRYVLRGRAPSLPGLQENGNAPAKRPILRGIRLEGGGPFDEERIRRRLRLKTGTPLDRGALNDGLERLIDFYRRRDYLMAEASAEETAAGTDGIDLTVRIRPGPRIRIAVEGVRHAEALRQSIAPHWEKGIFLDDIVGEARDHLVRSFHDRGYLSADAVPEIVRSDAERFEVRFSVRRGGRVRAGEVRIEGARAVPETAVRRLLRTGPDTLLSRGIVRQRDVEADVEAIRALYRTSGLPRAIVSSPEVRLDERQRRAVVTFRIEEGPRVILQRVRFEGAAGIAEDRLREIAALGEGGPFTSEAAEAAAARLRRAYDDGGYAGARVEYTLETAAVAEGEERADLVFRIREGTQERVGRVEVGGNLVTRDPVVRRALTFEPGSPLSRNDLLESQRRLYQRGLFTGVQVVPEKAEGPGTGPGGPGNRGVRVSLREAAPIAQVFGLGYDSEERLRVQYEIFNRNIFGSGRFLGFQVRGSDTRQVAAVSYREMGIFGGRYDALASAFGEEEDRPGFDVQRVGGAVQIDRKFSRATRVYYRYVLEDAEEEPLTPEAMSTIRLSGLSYTAVHDTRTAPFDPLDGHYLSGELQAYGRRIGSQAQFVRGIAQLLFFREVFPKTVWAQAVRAGAAYTFGRTSEEPALTGDPQTGLPPSERYYAGGDTTLRGFGRDLVGPLDDGGRPLGGEGVFVFNEELRFPIWRFLQGVLFLDVGNVYRTLDAFDLTDLRECAGAGLRIATPIGPFRLEYGRIIDRREGESRGQFFFSIGQAF